jgi:hypothetical protein
MKPKPKPKPEYATVQAPLLPAVVDKFRETFSIYISRMPYADRATQLKYLKDRRARLHADKIKNAKVVTPLYQQQGYDNIYIKPLAPPMNLKPPPPPRTRENSIEKIFANNEPKQPAFIFV